MKNEFVKGKLGKNCIFFFYVLQEVNDYRYNLNCNEQHQQRASKIWFILC